VATAQIVTSACCARLRDRHDVAGHAAFFALRASRYFLILVSKFGLGVPHYRLERDLADQGVPLDRGTMGRYMEQAGNTLGATIVACDVGRRDRERAGNLDGRDWSAEPVKSAKDGLAQACKKGHFFTAVVECDTRCCSRTSSSTPAKASSSCSKDSEGTYTRTRATSMTSSSTGGRMTRTKA
jgi:hypothetical protein